MNEPKGSGDWPEGPPPTPTVALVLLKALYAAEAAATAAAASEDKSISPKWLDNPDAPVES